MQITLRKCKRIITEKIQQIAEKVFKNFKTCFQYIEKIVNFEMIF